MRGNGDTDIHGHELIRTRRTERLGLPVPSEEMREMKGEKGGSRFEPGDADVGPHQLAPMGSDATGFEALERYRTRQGVKRKPDDFGCKPTGRLPTIKNPTGHSAYQRRKSP